MVDNIEVVGKKDACMDMEYIHGQVARHTKASTKWTKRKDMAVIDGKMAEGTLVSGKITRDMEKDV